MAKKKLLIPRASKWEDKDVLIGINGKNYLIPKGKETEVPPAVYEEYLRAQAAEDYFYDKSEEMQEDAAKSAAAAGL